MKVSFLFTTQIYTHRQTYSNHHIIYTRTHIQTHKHTKKKQKKPKETSKNKHFKNALKKKKKSSENSWKIGVYQSVFDYFFIWLLEADFYGQIFYQL